MREIGIKAVSMRSCSGLGTLFQWTRGHTPLPLTAGNFFYFWGSIVVGLLTMISVSSASASPLPQIPSATFGVAMHGANVKDINAAAHAGAKFIRIDLPWDRTEKAKGVYSWEAYVPLLSAMRAAGVRPILVLAYGNSLYSQRISVERHGSYSMKPIAPSDPNTVQAYTNWVRSAVSEFSQFDPVYEVWNEPDVGHFWPPRADPDAYAQLVTAACTAIHAMAHQAPVVAGTSEAPGIRSGQFLKYFLTLPASHCPDVISAHPYLVWGDLNKYPAMWSTLKSWMMAGPAAHAKLAATESSVSAVGGISEAMQARYLVLMLLQNVANDVALDIWYDWKDDGTDPNNEQHHFGLEYPNGAPKPALLAFSELSRAMDGMRFKCTSMIGSTTGYVFYGKQQDRLFFDGNANKNNKLLSGGVQISNTGIDFIDFPKLHYSCSH